MSKQALMKDFRVEIRKSLNRFLSIFFIVAMGVAFFSGVRATEPDMRYSGDAYFDARNMMDLKVLSTLGLTEDDIEAIRMIEGVENVEAGYMIDVLSLAGEGEHIIHIESLPKTMNKVDVDQGRLPEKTGECIVDMDMADAANIQIGDVITFQSGTEDSLEDTLSLSEYVVVGTCSSPMYISFNRGSTNIGNGEISMFAYITEENFCQEVYSQAYVTVTGAKEATSFTDGYKNIVEEVQQRIEDISDVRCDIRYAEIMDEANEEIEEAEEELEDAKEEVSSELADAKEELVDGQEALRDGRAELITAEQEMIDAKQKLDNSRKTLDASWDEYYRGLDQIETGKKEIQKAEAEIVANEKILFDGEKAIAEGASLLKENEEKLLIGENAIKEAELEINANEAKVIEAEQGLKDAKALISGLETGWQAYNDGYKELEHYKDLLAWIQVAIDLNLATPEQLEQAEQLKTAVSEGEAELNSAKAQLDEMEAFRPQAEEAIAREAEIIEARQALDAGKAEFEARKAEVAAGRQELEAGKAELEAQKEQIALGYQQLEDGKAQIAIEKQNLIEAEDLMKNSYKQLTDGEAAYQEGLKQLQDGKAQIAQAYAVIAENSQKLADGWEEYEKGKKEAEAEIFDAEIKIQDAKNEIAGIESPSWYVNSRESDADYVGYADNADRMGAIGKVFPILFFLVAALVSLTTMTRMVEENRMQIGTLKALGYSKFWIAFKYIGYALMATLGGSVLGVLFGEKVFPWIIVNAYKIMYIHIPDVVVPYHIGYALMATIAAVACTMLATISSCYKALAAQPAALMRPEAPQVGKKVFLERIPAIWTSLNFTWKSTIRNLMRYKKRFFMTIFGIGGCMALMLVGYGLKDSIMDVSNLQFGKIQIYDMMAVVDEDMSDEERDILHQELNKDDRIEGYIDGYMRMTEMTVGTTQKDIYLYVPSTLNGLDQFITFNYRKTGETWNLSEDSVVITEKVARDLGIEKGDEIQLELEENERFTVQITDVCENYLAHYIYMAPKVYEKLMGEQTKLNNVYVSIKEENINELTKVGEVFLKHDDVLTISYTSNMAADLTDMIQVLDSVIIVLIVAAGMLAFVVLYNLNNININERKRELATLKVLGFYDDEVAAYVYRENILLTIMGSGVGVVLGKLLHRFIVKTVEVDQTMFGLNITMQSYLTAIGFTILFSILVNGVMYFKLKKIDMVESLKSVE